MFQFETNPCASASIRAAMCHNEGGLATQIVRVAQNRSGLTCKAQNWNAALNVTRSPGTAHLAEAHEDTAGLPKGRRSPPPPQSRQSADIAARERSARCPRPRLHQPGGRSNHEACPPGSSPWPEPSTAPASPCTATSSPLGKSDIGHRRRPAHQGQFQHPCLGRPHLGTTAAPVVSGHW
jgi:hypothetical protein